MFGIGLVELVVLAAVGLSLPVGALVLIVVLLRRKSTPVTDTQQSSGPETTASS